VAASFWQDGGVGADLPSVWVESGIGGAQPTGFGSPILRLGAVHALELSLLVDIADEVEAGTT
jgi:hypothetical protein